MSKFDDINKMLDEIQEGLDTCPFCEEDICLVHTATATTDMIPDPTGAHARQLTKWREEDTRRHWRASGLEPSVISAQELVKLEEEEKHHSHGRLTREVMQLLERSDDSIPSNSGHQQARSSATSQQSPVASRSSMATVVAAKGR